MPCPDDEGGEARIESCGDTMFNSEAWFVRDCVAQKSIVRIARFRRFDRSTARSKPHVLHQFENGHVDRTIVSQ